MAADFQAQWRLFGVLEFEHAVKTAFQHVLENYELDFLSQELQSASEDDKRRFVLKSTLPYFCTGMRQAREYFSHAKEADYLVKPLLLYYAMMSMTKSLITLGSPDFFLVDEHRHHGVSVPRRGVGFDIETERIRVHRNGIYPLAHKALRQVYDRNDTEPALPASFEIKIKDLLCRIPDLGWHCETILKTEKQFLPLGQLGQLVQRFPVTGELQIARNLTKQEHEVVASAPRFPLERDFVLNERGDSTWSIRSRTFTTEPGPIEFLMDKYFDIDSSGNWYFIKRIDCNGYSMPVFQAELIYVLVFYLSSLARYHPHIWASLHEGKENLMPIVVEDAIRAAETLFLPLLTRVLTFSGIPFV